MENTENNKTISIAADDIANAWDDILQGIKARERTLYVLMTSNSGIDIMSEGEFIIFSVKNDWQAIRLNESRAKRLIENVIQKHLGLTSTPSIKIVSGNIEEKSIEKIVALANLSEQEWRHDNEEQLRQDLEQLRAIVHTKRRAQKILEQRHAKLGDITPVGIIIEMEDTVEEIKKHEAKIKEIKGALTKLRRDILDEMPIFIAVYTSHVAKLRTTLEDFTNEIEILKPIKTQIEDIQDQEKSIANRMQNISKDAISSRSKSALNRFGLEINNLIELIGEAERKLIGIVSSQ